MPHEFMEGVEGVAGGFIYTIQGKSAAWKVRSVLSLTYLILTPYFDGKGDFFFVIKKKALLIYNSQTLYPFKVVKSLVCGVRVLQTSLLIPDHFHRSRNPCPLADVPHSPLPQYLPTINFHAVLSDLKCKDLLLGSQFCSVCALCVLLPILLCLAYVAS